VNFLACGECQTSADQRSRNALDAIRPLSEVVDVGLPDFRGPEVGMAY